MPTCLRIYVSLIALALWARAESPIEFNRHIRPIFTQHCTACHGGVKEAGGLSLIFRERVLGETESGKRAVVPGHPELSEMVARITSDDPDEVMPKPKHGPKLSDREVETIREWIAQGAKWQEHWSFVLPENVPVPPASDWSLTPLDAWVEIAHRDHGLKPADEADLAEWLRRVSLDLTGLPATTAQLEALERDAKVDRKAAMEKIVDHLLASESYGERWASVWLDLARYADSTGFEKDLHRDAWPYRDWVIRAFNQDMPYDAFSIKQLAGDLLENPTADDQLATAFHRNTQTNTEGGTDDEEFRVAAVMDRVSTTWTAWQATTFSCVQCHSHPYDPIPHEDYYRFMAFFDQTEDNDLSSDFPKTKWAHEPSQRERAYQLEKSVRSQRTSINERALERVRKSNESSIIHSHTLDSSGPESRLEQLDDGIIVAHGTHPKDTVFRVIGEATAMGALSIEILPQSDDRKKWLEIGAVITGIEVDLIKPSGQRSRIDLREVLSDSLAGPLEPNDAIKEPKEGSENLGGFGSYPMLRGPHQSWIIFKQPLVPQAGERLEIRLKHGKRCHGDQQNCIVRKFRIRAIHDPTLPAWFANDERATNWRRYEETQQEYEKILGTMVPTLIERAPSAQRDTRMFARGNRMTPEQSVLPGIPEIVNPPVIERRMNRLDLAQWLMSDANPMAARVMANRLWAELFGLGIVETLEDFGTSGSVPSNQKLLDHLAIRFSQHHRWHLKPFLREIVLSATYRQTAKTSPELGERDPKNRWLARGPRQRLTAEMTRDQGLLVAQLLTPRLYGPPVFPPQPEGIWKQAFGQLAWQTSTGADRYRRAIYTYVKRTSGHPAMLTFDGTTRDLCSARRMVTNTPLQALVTLNDPAQIEFAQAYAQRMIQSSADSDERLRAGYRMLRLREPSQQTLENLKSLLDDLQHAYLADPENAAKLSNDAEHVAWVLVANTLLNLDANLTR
ncbi:MAG: DUF1553 domain-containing protein [Verrucomicrobia bacterium]|nr:MAG: DUF1553 domain-containing protein [Verrucomicrobiota bacterium]